MERELKKIHSEMNYLKKALSGSKVNSNGVTPEMIEMARQYPIGNLIELKRGKALCPFHDDHNPSMGIKNNRYRCFACGEHGDSISLNMKLNNLTFPETVRTLTGA